MTTVHWNFTVENKPHHLRLEHGLISGRQIWLDGVCILRERKWFNFISYHLFSIDGQRFELGIFSILTTSCVLLQDSTPVLSDLDLRKGKTADDLLKSTFLRHMGLWTELSQRLEIPYLPVPKAGWGQRYRLLGIKNGFLLMILPGFHHTLNLDGWLVTIRHAPLATEQISESIFGDGRIDMLLGKWRKHRKKLLVSVQNATTLFLPQMKHETGAELAGRIQIFFSLVAEQARSLNPQECEAPECAHRSGSQIRLVTVNKFPTFLCQDCIDDLPGMMKKEEQDYKNAPSHLDAGLVAGLGVALLGAVAWAGGMLALRVAVGMIPLAIFVGMVNLMDKVQAKRSNLFLLSAGVLTLFSVFLGNSLASFLLLIRQGAPLALGTLAAAWSSLFEAPEILKMSLGLTLFLVGIYFFQFWIAHRAALKQTFHPDVEVLPGEF